MSNKRGENGMTRILSIGVLAIVMVAACASPALAQKKTPVKKEVVAPPQRQTGIKEILTQYTGKTTNLGVLKKVEGDYFVFDDNGDISYHPLSTLHTIKLVKDQDTGEITIEIRLFARD
jgi:hypothetical protein